jgi:hypothetical protein
MSSLSDLSGFLRAILSLKSLANPSIMSDYFSVVATIVK